MIKFETQTLANGLQVIVHEDKATNIAVLNVAYKVGSRDEQEEHTGFAHLFEHLMFGGSLNIPAYDEPLQKAGGENNAYTTPDLTNYYLTVPANNIETGFWLESDRMLSLSFEPQVLEVQRKVVIEEFNQRYINQPYGDVWHKIREMVYKVHPYKWPTIGKDISHIESATMDLVQAFFKKYYVPNNAVLVIAGNINPAKAFSLAEKWFGPIPQGDEIIRSIPHEPKQEEKRLLEVHQPVPANAYYKAFNMPGRISSKYYTVDLLSDVLGRGKSSRLNEQLVEKDKIFSELSAYVMGSFDPGLLVISGKLTENITFSQAEEGVSAIIEEMLNSAPTKDELEKVKNQALSSLVFGEVQVLNRAMNLAYFALLGDANLANTENEMLQTVESQDILQQAQNILIENNSSTLYYHANEN
jgi:zinc protease